MDNLAPSGEDFEAVASLAEPIRKSLYDFVAAAAPRYFNYRKTSIYAGSNEIQRNIISKMALGL